MAINNRSAWKSNPYVSNNVVPSYEDYKTLYLHSHSAVPANTLGSLIPLQAAQKMHLATKEVKALRSKHGVQKFVR